MKLKIYLLMFVLLISSAFAYIDTSLDYPENNTIIYSANTSYNISLECSAESNFLLNFTEMGIWDLGINNTFNRFPDYYISAVMPEPLINNTQRNTSWVLNASSYGFACGFRNNESEYALSGYNNFNITYYPGCDITASNIISPANNTEIPWNSIFTGSWSTSSSTFPISNYSLYSAGPGMNFSISPRCYNETVYSFNRSYTLNEEYDHNYSSPFPKNFSYRVFIPASQLQPSQLTYRLQINFTAPYSDVIYNSVIFGEAGANPWEIGSGTTLTFNGSNSVTITNQSSVLSDLLGYEIDPSKNHILAFEVNNNTASLGYSEDYSGYLTYIDPKEYSGGGFIPTINLTDTVMGFVDINLANIQTSCYYSITNMGLNTSYSQYVPSGTPVGNYSFMVEACDTYGCCINGSVYTFPVVVSSPEDSNPFSSTEQIILLCALIGSFALVLLYMFTDMNIKRILLWILGLVIGIIAVIFIMNGL